MRTEKIKEVLANKQALISLKKAQFKSVDAVCMPMAAEKSFLTGLKSLPEDTSSELYRSVIANTYYYMDSHDDVHVSGIFTKTIQENKNIFLLHDHEFKLSGKIGEILEAREQSVKWSDVGLNLLGETEALILDVEISKKRNENVFEMYKNGDINQHSVGMQYVKIELAVDDEDDKAGKSLFDKILPMLGNKEEAEEQGYFFVVQEAKLREVSAVLLGSNPLTGIFNSGVKNLDLEKIFNYFATDAEKVNEAIKFCNQFLSTHGKPGTTTLTTEPQEIEEELKKEFLLQILKK